MPPAGIGKLRNDFPESVECKGSLRLRLIGSKMVASGLDPLSFGN